MELPQKEYKIREIDCESCKKKIKVIISPIETLVTNNVYSIEGVSQENVSQDIITNYIVVNCDCGKRQRVFIKKADQ